MYIERNCANVKKNENQNDVYQDKTLFQIAQIPDGGLYRNLKLPEPFEKTSVLMHELDFKIPVKPYSEYSN